MSKDMYVGIEDPLTHRKNLLMCSKDLITSLKNYERLKAIRAEKVERIYELRKTIQEIIVLNRKLKQFLPKMALPKMATPEPQHRTVHRKPLTKTKVKTKVDLLERELDRIESKLKRLE